MTLTIVGAGMAGLLAANLLSHHDTEIVEAQPQLPNNHSAVLRFRTPNVGTALHIPFKPVQMIKDALRWRNPVADALMYSYKNHNRHRSDRSIVSGFKSETRYIAPDDLIQQMAARVKIKYGVKWETQIAFPPTISTIPMPALMKLLDFSPLPVFEYVEGCNISTWITDCDAYVSLLVPDPAYIFSRISLMGNKIIVECPTLDDVYEPVELVAQAAYLLGLDEYCSIDESHITVQKQQYAKIQPIDNDLRKQFIWWATDQCNIYSLGRFATWRPHLLIDDLLQDVQLIDHWLSSRDRYSIAKRRIGGANV